MIIELRKCEIHCVPPSAIDVFLPLFRATIIAHYTRYRKLCCSIRMEIDGPECLPAFFVYLLYEPQLREKMKKKNRTIAPQQQPDIRHSRSRENEKTNIRNRGGGICGDLHFAAK